MLTTFVTIIVYNKKNNYICDRKKVMETLHKGSAQKVEFLFFYNAVKKESIMNTVYAKPSYRAIQDASINLRKIKGRKKV